MQDALLLIMTLIGALAIYWALFGQWKHNKMMKESEEALEKEENKKNHAP
ncbi:MAG: hypothetical protein Q7S65_04015 [Nanoarchaeota archaeon]|nr:hypothetical protein [Nanoarchaeota archaeon]